MDKHKKLATAMFVLLGAIGVVALVLAALAYTKADDASSDSSDALRRITALETVAVPLPTDEDMVLVPNSTLTGGEWSKRPKLYGTGRIPAVLYCYQKQETLTSGSNFDCTVPVGIFETSGDSLMMEFETFNVSPSEGFAIRFNQGTTNSSILAYVRAAAGELADRHRFTMLVRFRAPNDVEYTYGLHRLDVSGFSVNPDQVTPQDYFGIYQGTTISIDMTQSFNLQIIPTGATVGAYYSKYTFFPANGL